MNYKVNSLYLSILIGVILCLFSISLGLFGDDAVKIARPHFTDNQDIFSRNYRIKWNGDILFTLDDSYKEALPDSSQLAIHIAEAKVLVEKRKVYPAIRLLKGITLCQRQNFKGRRIPNPEIQKSLNRLLAENQDRQEELKILTEPYGCYALNKKNEKKLFIESKDFGYTYELDARFRYVFPNDLYRFARKEKEYNWKVSYFRILLSEDPGEKTFESEYFRYEKGIFYENPSRIMLSIGQTYHIHTLVDIMHYPDIWDGRRGLSSTIKRSSNFQRYEVENGLYETSFNLSEEIRTVSYFGYESYRFMKNKGLGLFLTCPFASKTECIQIWNAMK